MKQIRALFPATILIALFTGMMLLLSGCSVMEEEVQESYLFAVGTGRCTVQEALIYLLNIQGAYTDDIGDSLWPSMVSGDASVQETAEDLVISRLLYIYCMDQMAENEGVALTEEEENLISSAAAAYMETLTASDLEILDVDAGDIEEYYAHFALAEKYYDEKTADVIISQTASSEEEQEALLEEAKEAAIEADYEEFLAGVQIEVDETVLSEAAEAAGNVTTNQFFEIYNGYMQ